MRMDWEEDLPFGSNSISGDQLSPAEAYGSRRLDLLLPVDEETGAASTTALHVYVDAMVEMVGRSGQPMSLLCIGVDETSMVRFFGSEGIHLIGRAVARCLRQETRSHDVVGRADVDADAEMPLFMIVCPLLDEEQAALLAERLRAAMTAHADDPGSPWLTLSVGVASYSLDIVDGRELMARAYAALHRAQQRGGGRVWRNSDTLCAFLERNRDDSDHFENGHSENDLTDNDLLNHDRSANNPSEQRRTEPDWKPHSEEQE